MTVPDISSARRRYIGGVHASLNHARKRAVKQANAADEAPWAFVPAPRYVWDLRERETVERARVATDGVWRAYVNSAELRRAAEWQRFQEDPEAAAAMVRVEQRLAALEDEAKKGATGR